MTQKCNANTDLSVLENLKKIFEQSFGDESVDKTSAFDYLPEEKWLALKKHGLLTPFLPVQYGGQPPNQRMLLDVLRLAAHYTTSMTLRTGIEGSLVIQPLTHHAKPELVQKVLPLILDGAGGGLAITEPDSAGSSIAKNMVSYYQILDNGNIYIHAKKHWQGNSQNEFLLVAAKEKKNNQLQKQINLLFVPSEYIRFTPIHSEGLHAVRYAVNHIEGEIPAENLITLSELPQKNLRAFQSLFIRSRLQFIGMTHGVLEKIQFMLKKHTLRQIDFIEYERQEIDLRQMASQVLYDYVCANISPDQSVSDRLLEANIVKTVGSELTYSAARIAQKLMGANGYERGHPVSQIVNDIRPFTLFEGPNDMLFAEIFEQFSKLTAEEKTNGVFIDKEATLHERFLSDKRFVFKHGKENLPALFDSIYRFVSRHQLKEVGSIQKVFVGKILSKLFILGRTQDRKLMNFLVREINKDILDFSYC